MLLSAAFSALLAAAPAPQEVEAPTPAPALAPAITLLTEAHGGRETLAELVGVRFQMTPYRYPAATEEEPEPEAEPGDPMGFSIVLGGDTGRRIRIDQRAGDDELVRIVSAVRRLVFIGGELRESESLGAEASVLAAEVVSTLDLVWGLATGHLEGVPEQRRRRDGVDYHTVRANFPENRRIASIYLAYINPATGLVDRVDVHDPATKRRLSTVLFSDYVGEDVKLPTAVQFLDRSKQPIARWAVTTPEFNPEWPEGHFEQP